MTVTQTSIYAFSMLGDLGARQRQVYDGLKQLGEATNTELARFINLPINQVTPRVKELREKKAVFLSRKRNCSVTNKMVSAWRTLG